MMREFFAIVRLKDSTSAITFSFKEDTVLKAIDEMYRKSGARAYFDIDEYELLEVIEVNKYVPVSQKFLSNKEWKKPRDTPQRAEKTYTSYRDAA